MTLLAILKKKKRAQQCCVLLKRPVSSIVKKANCLHEQVLNEISRFVSAKFSTFGTAKSRKNGGENRPGFVPLFPPAAGQ